MAKFSLVHTFEEFHDYAPLDCDDIDGVTRVTLVGIRNFSDYIMLTDGSSREVSRREALKIIG